ncbi:MAG: RNA polymerase sigma factor RpoD/SigA [Sphaerochaetaceae bacterium]|nr:RNA polymerase sigma factor RpoD/SigA [Sphaerochaetaceae bacterium]MDD2406951.1 RNA polymerase sigma factor RpoD/SigA [Sphaerochaetaceae bacterium]MDD4259084.1 RNA polymerase sigma factor RpoD/SigA [Sphaerochaetaceae bacterium]MDD4763479.1 RNA polymerase sigma factor RpoD/SigA [Sphaerochaetaceae bacterium]
MSKSTKLHTAADQYEDANILSMYLKEINRIPLMTREEEEIIARKAAEGDPASRKRLIEANLRFVVNVAKKYQNQGLPLIDLINEGNIGLMNAIEKYDVDRGYHFISYAVWWIKQSILKAICEKSRTVRLPLNRANELLQIQKAQRVVMHDTGEEPTMEELGEITQMDPKLIGDLLSISKEMVSLDAPVFGDPSNSTVGDFIEDNYRSADDIVMEKSLRDDINDALAMLTEKERDIIEMRYGLNGAIPMSLKEIGELYNLTKERIRQIEKKALERMKNPTRLKILASYTA